MEEQNYLKEIVVCLLVVVTILIAASFVPAWNMGGIPVKRVNIFSDIVSEVLPKQELIQQHDTVAADTVVTGKSCLPDTVRMEDFSSDRSLQVFCKRLERGEGKKRGVRIGFLGDSYIEADIITEDVREWLQKRYGGRGVGFVPVSSPAEGYRLTVEHASEGWQRYTMVYHQKADWKKLLVSGEYFVPGEGAMFRVKGTKVKGEQRFGEARFFFLNSGETQIAVKADGRDTLYRPPANDTLLQDICLRGNLQELEYRFTNTAGFTGFGVFLNDPTGVYVDNFSVRSSSGIVLSIMNEELVVQLSQVVNYDLLVLQFGLNVVLPDSEDYGAYRRQMVRTIAHLKKCFPQTVFLLMSVSDRGYRQENGYFGTKPGVVRLVEEQREIAREAGIAFWNMFEAMGGKDAMAGFVKREPAWANKDYTHINHLGGKHIAGEMVKAFQAEIR